MTFEPLEHLEYWLEGVQSKLNNNGVSVELSRSPPGRSKRSLGVYLQAGDRGGFLEVWDTGECQLSVVDYSSVADPVESRHWVQSSGDLRNVVGLLLSWIRQSI
ncbi:immunity protein TriTu family protein [Saccharothrix coeruleofusca]|uniref:immunity protein TriTu family protein n=1 Tax=Saccharothrix coeruleofusca TaxID=33919 RepID=UPI003FD7BF46